MSTLERVANIWGNWMYAASWQLALLVLLIASLVWLTGLIKNINTSRICYALWLLVLIKVFLPPTLAMPFGIGTWGVAPITRSNPMVAQILSTQPVQPMEASEKPGESQQMRDDSQFSSVIPITLFCIWLVGGVAFLGGVVWRHVWLTHSITNQPIVDEGPLCVSMERAAMKLGIDQSPEIRITDALTSPFLFGVVHPCVVLPRRFVDQASEKELAAVLTHELVHLRRRDTLVGWIQVIAQAVFWFHPMVWWANREIRHYREEVCDDSVLSEGDVQSEAYGESMMRVLTTANARSFAEGTMVGVFEKGTKLQTRLEKIMNHNQKDRVVGWKSRAFTLAIAGILLPMSQGILPVTDAQEVAETKSDAPKSTSPFPQIVKTSPKVGELDVKADLKSIRVTFDRDMSGGMSWTGGPPQFPTIDKSRKPRWIERRTCVLPVQVEKGKFYRLGINSKTHHNFKSVTGKPALPSAIYFATEGATPEVQALAKVPAIVKLEPANGATVSPDLKAIKVTFNMPMGAGMSWTGGGETFPKIPKSAKPTWSADKKTCTLPVKLKPNHEYHMGLNSPRHNNFQSAAGVSLEPITYQFATSGQ